MSEMALWAQWLHSGDCTAGSSCDVFALSTGDLELLLQDFGSKMLRVAIYARQYVLWMNRIDPDIDDLSMKHGSTREPSDRERSRPASFSGASRRSRSPKSPKSPKSPGGFTYEACSLQSIIATTQSQPKNQNAITRSVLPNASIVVYSRRFVQCGILCCGMLWHPWCVVTNTVSVLRTARGTCFENTCVVSFKYAALNSSSALSGALLCPCSSQEPLFPWPNEFISVARWGFFGAVPEQGTIVQFLQRRQKLGVGTIVLGAKV